MPDNDNDRGQLIAELDETRGRLREALETIDAIRSGGLDALVERSGDGELLRVSQQLFAERGYFDQYRTLLDSMGEGAVLIVPDGTIVYSNAPFAVAVRKHLEEVVGADFRDFLPAADLPRFDAMLQQARRATAREEVKLAATDGSQLTAQLSLRFMRAGSREWACMVVTDLTERKHTEERIRNLNTELERRVAQLIEASVDAVLATDPEFRITDANERMTQLSGFTRQELIGTQFPVLVQQSEQALECMQAALAQGVVKDFELDLRRRNGDVVPVAIDARTFHTGPGEKHGVFIALRDIAERQRVDRERALLASIVASSEDAICSLTLNTLVTSWNHGAEKLLGFTAAEAIGRSLNQFAALEGRTAINQHMSRALRDLSVQQFETCLRRRDLSLIEVSINLAPILDKTGQPSGIALIARDITERKRFEQQLVGERDRALSGARVNLAFLGGLGREILTPLSSIAGMTELLFDTTLTALQRQYLHDVEHNATRLADVVNSALDSSRLSAGQLFPEQVDFDLQAILDRALKAALGVAGRAQIEIGASIESGTPRRLRGDPARLRRILSTLLKHAIRLSERSQITVTATRCDGAPGKTTLRFEVRAPAVAPDSIPEQLRGFGAPGATADRLDGLDLAVARQLVELMGGTAALLCTPASGLTLWFTAGFAAPTADIGPASPQAQAELEGVRALIVEDDAPHRDLLKLRLTAWQMAPDTAGNAAEALQLLRQCAQQERPYALALLDAQMPEVDGIELARQIRREPEIAATPLLLFSLLGGAADFASRLAGLDIEAFVAEPVEQSDLREAIAGALDRQRPAPVRSHGTS